MDSALIRTAASFFCRVVSSASYGPSRSALPWIAGVWVGATPPETPTTWEEWQLTGVGYFAWLEQAGTFIPGEESDMAGWPAGVFVGSGPPANAKTYDEWSTQRSGYFAWMKTPAPIADVTAPVLEAFTLGTPSALSIPIDTLTANDNLGVTGWCVTTTPSTPPLESFGAKPTTWVAPGAGTYTLYAWARDAAGNVSSTLAAGPVTVSSGPTDVAAPIVRSFTLGAPNALVVPITAFTADDDLAVTGWCVTSSASVPALGAFGAKPTSWTAPGTGSYTLYGWARDAAGNVSLPLSAPVTVSNDASDDFNRADAPDLGSNWAAGAAVASNRAYGVGRWLPLGAIGNQYAQVELMTPPGVIASGPMVRMNASQMSGYWASVVAGGGGFMPTLYRWDNGAATPIAIGVVAIPTSEKILRLEIMGNALSVKSSSDGVTWNLRQSVTDNTYATGLVGFRVDAPAVSIDNFRGGPL